MFTPKYSTIEPTCSINCLIEYNREKKARNTAGLNKMRNEKIKLEDLEALKKQTQDVVNLYIRLRDKGKTCISCGHKLGQYFDAGHIFDKKQHSMIRYDLDCLAGQCQKCNRFYEGRYDNARIEQEKRIGVERYQKLFKRSQIALRVPYTWTRSDLKEIQKKVKSLTKNLPK